MSNEDLCASCHAELPLNQAGPCPKCGATGKLVRRELHNGLQASDQIRGAQISESWVWKPTGVAVAAGGLALTTVVGAFGGSPLLGLLVGAAIEGVSVAAFPAVREKVVTRREF